MLAIGMGQRGSISGTKVYSTSFGFGCRSDYIFDCLIEDVDNEFVVVYPA